MPGHVKVSGAWKALDGMHVNVGGVWKEVTDGFINVSGVWKQFFENVTLALSGESVVSSQIDPDNAHARLRIDDDGKVYKSEDTGTPSWTQIDTLTDWIRPVSKAPDDYEVRYTGLTGDALTSATAAVDVWHPLSTGDFDLVNSETIIPGNQSSTFTVEIRKGSSGAALVSASYTLTADVTA